MLPGPSDPPAKEDQKEEKAGPSAPPSQLSFSTFNK